MSQVINTPFTQHKNHYTQDITQRSAFNSITDVQDSTLAPVMRPRRTSKLAPLLASSSTPVQSTICSGTLQRCQHRLHEPSTCGHRAANRNECARGLTRLLQLFGSINTSVMNNHQRLIVPDSLQETKRPRVAPQRTGCHGGKHRGQD